MIYAYHKAIADGVGLPLIAFQFPKAFGPDFPPETLARLATIPEIIGLKEASFDTTKTVETIAAARALPRKLGIMTGSDTFICEAMVMGCDGALIGFASTATRELIEMQRAVEAKDFVARVRDLGAPGPARALLLARADPRLPPAHEGSAEDAGTHRSRHGARAAARRRRCGAGRAAQAGRVRGPVDVHRCARYGPSVSRLDECSVRSARAASSGSCVTITSAVPIAALSSSMRSNT